MSDAMRLMRNVQELLGEGHWTLVFDPYSIRDQCAAPREVPSIEELH